MIQLGIITTRKQLSVSQIVLIQRILSGFVSLEVHIGDSLVFKRHILQALDKCKNITELKVHPSNNYSATHVPIILKRVPHVIFEPQSVDKAYEDMIGVCSHLMFCTYKKTDLIQGEIITAIRLARTKPNKDVIIIDHKGHIRYGASNKPRR